MNFKNNKPKSYKGHCAMCAMGLGRCQRVLTMQERRAAVGTAEQLLDPVRNPVCGDDFICDWCLENSAANDDGIEHRDAMSFGKLGDLLRTA